MNKLILWGMISIFSMTGAHDLSSKAAAVSDTVLGIYKSLQQLPCTRQVRHLHFGHGPVCPLGICIFKLPPQAFTGVELSNVPGIFLYKPNVLALNNAIILGNYFNIIQDPALALNSLNASLAAITLYKAHKDHNQTCALLKKYLEHQEITQSEFLNYTTNDLVGIQNRILEGMQLLTFVEQAAARDYFQGTVSFNPVHMVLAQSMSHYVGKHLNLGAASVSTSAQRSIVESHPISLERLEALQRKLRKGL